MELAHAREARLEHLNIGLSRDRCDVVGGQPVEEAVHDFPPAPEIVVGSPAATRPLGAQLPRSGAGGPGGHARCRTRRAHSGYTVCSIRNASIFIVWALLPVVTARSARASAASARLRAPRTGAA